MLSEALELGPFLGSMLLVWGARRKMLTADMLREAHKHSR